MSHSELNIARKRKRCERIFRFKTFGIQGHPVEFNSTFRENVKALLEFGHLESKFCKGMPSWSFQLEVQRHPPHHILLFIVEEPIEASLSRHCKHCKYIGWGHHMICNKKYHFLLPSKDTVADCLIHHCNDDEATSANVKPTLVELKGHLLHGVIHSNGFGHLLSINGVEAGSDLSGQHIMEFWDRLCTGLQVRKVSANDISKKKGIELRLLHGVAYGRSWFGQWGYKFGRGSFGVTQPVYQKAIEALQNMPLSLIYHQVGTSNPDILVIMSRYLTLSDNSLMTLSDLFHFMLELKSRLPKENCIESYSPGILAETACRWSAKRVEMATQVIVDALRRAKCRWVSRQEVRDAARAYIGDTGLLDFVLKSLGNHIVGNYLVRRSLNPVTKVLEYCLEDISNVLPNQEGMLINNSKIMARYKISRIQLMKDIFSLYNYIIRDHSSVVRTGILSVIPVAMQIILDTKYMVKVYESQPCTQVLGMENKLKLHCTILLRNNERGNNEGNYVLEPYQCITLKSNATIDELKKEVEKCFKDLYWGLRKFVVESVLNLSANKNDQLYGLVDVGSKLFFEGSNKEELSISDDMYERGLNNCMVDCCCGTKDDDGERMISCDICEVWRHTRCVQIPDLEEIPHVFICKRCEQGIILAPSLL